MSKSFFQAPVSTVVRDAMQNYYGDLAKQKKELIPLDQCRLQRKITSLAVEWVCSNWLALNPARPA